MSSLPISVGRSGPHFIPRERSATGSMDLLPLVLILYASLLPVEVHFAFGGQYFYPPRIAEILVVPWLFSRLLRGDLQFHRVDAGFLLGSGWMVLSFAIYYGTAADTMRAFAVVIDMVIPYLVARVAIKSTTDVRLAFIYFAPGVFLAGLFILLESISHTAIVKPAATAIFGRLPLFEGGGAIADGREYGEFRFGLLRASGGFPHPILAGLYLVSSLTIYASSSIRRTPYALGVIAGLFCFFTVSSTAFMSFLLFLALLVYDRIQRLTTFLNWRIFLILAGLGIFVLQFGSKSGAVPIITRFALDPVTGYYRRLIWEYGTISVGKHPWFGIGLTPYERLPWMVESIDNYWLLLAVRHGFLAPILILATLIPTMWMLSGKSIHRSEADRRLFVGLASSLFIMSLLIFTVALFGGFTTWYFAILGLSLSATLSPAAARPYGEQQPPAKKWPRE